MAGLVVPLAALAQFSGPGGETFALVLACLVALAGVVARRYQRVLAIAAALVLVALLLNLAFHFIADHFQYRYVWLYSAAELPVYLKLASIWGGEEGSLLMMAAFLAVLATRLVGYSGWAAGAILLYVAGFTVGAIVWNPFDPSPINATPAIGRGMNVHLMSVWMACHPPLIFFAYALVLAPTGAALEALVRGSGSWRAIAERFLRAGWLLLSTGLVIGMWWAFEDFTFGQIWHWDPVQTSVFVIWALMTAQLHGLSRFRGDGLFARSLPLLSSLASAAVFASMAITRNAALASSHRYVGETSAPLLWAMAVFTALAGALAWARSRRRRIAAPAAPEAIWLLRAAAGMFVLLAVVSAGGIIHALAGAYLDWPRPEWAKPFFETLARWSSASEQDSLSRAFSRWDVDSFAVNRWMAPIACAIMLLAGHAFGRYRKRTGRWIVTGSVALAGLAVGAYLNPLGLWFDGTGVTSQQTVALFFWLDVMLVYALYLVVSVLVWIAGSLRYPAPGRLRRLGVGLIHGGAAIVLPAIAVSMVLDSYVQAVVSSAEDFGRPQKLADGFAVSVSFVDSRSALDGGRDAGHAAYRTLGSVDVTLARNKGVASAFSGYTLYRNQGETLNDPGPVRQLCQILDYRYARFAGGPRYILNPFVERGWAATHQVWVSPQFDGNPTAGHRQSPTGATVVVRTYPLLRWVWVGLGMMILGAAAVTVCAYRRPAEWFG